MHRPFRYLLAAWLALAFPLGQHAALLHALGHAAAVADEKQDTQPSPEQCPDHSLYAGFAGAIDCAVPSTPVVGANVVAAVERFSPDASLAPRYAFLSRAPPHLLPTC